MWVAWQVLRKWFLCDIINTMGDETYFYDNLFPGWICPTQRNEITIAGQFWAWVNLPYKPKWGLWSQINKLEVCALLRQTVHDWPHWLYWLPVEVHPGVFWCSFHVERGGEVQCMHFVPVPVFVSALIRLPEMTAFLYVRLPWLLRRLNASR